MGEDTWGNAIDEMHTPAEHAAELTLHDTNELAKATKAIYVGGFGDVKVKTVNGEDVTFKNVPAGTILPVRIKLAFDTGSTATFVVGLY